jgi:hypothetical protein
MRFVESGRVSVWLGENASSDAGDPSSSYSSSFRGLPPPTHSIDDLTKCESNSFKKCSGPWRRAIPTNPALALGFMIGVRSPTR